MKKLHTRRGGFTLIELMIVVAIIGILAAIAIPNFLRFQLKAKSSEGKTNLAAIRTAEESYFAEYGAYVSADSNPTGPPGAGKQTFTGNAAFNRLGWSPEGQVYFNYAVEDTTSGTPGFYASAEADIDADSTEQIWGYRKNATIAKANSGGTTCATGIQSRTVVACDLDANALSGQSVF